MRGRPGRGVTPRRPARSHRLLLVAAVLLGTVLPAVPAWAHAEFLGSKPSGDATVERAPRRVTLRFSEPVEPDFATVQVVAPDGDRVERGQVRVDEGRVRAPLEPLTAPGTYTVAFRVVSVDGHTVESSFEFRFAPSADAGSETADAVSGAGAATAVPSAAASAAVSGAPSAVPSPAADGGSALPAASTAARLQDAGPGTARGLLAVRMANHLLFALVVGLLLGAAVLLASPGRLSRTARRCALGAAGAAAAWALSGVALFAFALSNAAARPLPEALAPDLIARFAGTRLGLVVAAQVAVAAVIVLAALVARSTAGARMVLALAAVAAGAPALWGHAAADDLAPAAVASDWAHVLAAAAWAGGLAVVALMVTAEGDIDVAVPTARYSRIAGWSLAVVGLTGVANAALHVSAPSQLWTTGWGRLVLAKVVLFAVVGLVGAVNRFQVLPRLAGRGARTYARAAFRQFAIVEVVVMLVAFGVATGLGSATPAEAEAAQVPSMVADFADGQVNVSLDPGRAGANTVHVYFLDGGGRPRPVTAAAVSLTSAGRTLPVAVYDAGPGHVTALGRQVPRSGRYGITVTARVDGRRHRATGAIDVR